MARFGHEIAGPHPPFLGASVGVVALPPAGVGWWVGVSQIEELRRPSVSLHGMGMGEDIYMD